MRQITQAGLDLIKRFEGFSPVVYLCPAGKRTIGFGHVVRPWESFADGGGVTREQATALLMQDVAFAQNGVLRLITVALTDGQFDALVSFTFNLGCSRLQASTLRARLNRGDATGAADEFLRWTLVRGRRSEGLLRRRQAERERFLS